MEKERLAAAMIARVEVALDKPRVRFVRIHQKKGESPGH